MLIFHIYVATYGYDYELLGTCRVRASTSIYLYCGTRAPGTYRDVQCSYSYVNEIPVDTHLVVPAPHAVALGAVGAGLPLGGGGRALLRGVLSAPSLKKGKQYF